MLHRWFRRERSIDPGQFTPWPEAAVLVGGAVRDALLGRPARDLDWLVADPEASARSDAARRDGSAFALDAARGHWRVVAKGPTSDFVRLVGALERDLLRRDFTINAMALERDGTLHDPTRGMRDLSAGRIRMVSRANLEDDPLRPLRGVRIASELGFALESATRGAIHEIASRQGRGIAPLPAPERVRDELDALLAGARPGRALLLLDDLGLLDVVLPELAQARDVHQGGFHHLPVLRHMIDAVQRLVTTFPDADLALRWATLLHDVGKPSTRERGEDGRVRFYGHDRTGARMATDLLRRLRQPDALVKRVAELVRHHMVQLPRNEREARRFVHRRRTILPDLLRLMIADREAARGPLASEANRRAYRVALDRILAILAEPPPERPLLDGREVMDLLGVPEGPHVGEALRFLGEAEAVGDIGTRDEAITALSRYAAAQGWSRPGDGTGAKAEAGTPDTDASDARGER